MEISPEQQQPPSGINRTHPLLRIYSNEHDLIRTCLSKNPKLDCWVHESIASRLSIELLEILLPVNLDINYILGRPGRYLTLAVRKDDINLTRYLLDHGADVNKPGVTYRFPPLTLAVSNDNAEMAELLIQHGAVINGSGALGMATSRRRFGMIGLLLGKYGADVNDNDNDLKTNRLRLVMGGKDFSALHEGALRDMRMWLRVWFGMGLILVCGRLGDGRLVCWRERRGIMRWSGFWRMRV